MQTHILNNTLVDAERFGKYFIKSIEKNFSLRKSIKIVDVNNKFLSNEHIQWTYTDVYCRYFLEIV